MTCAFVGMLLGVACGSASLVARESKQVVPDAVKTAHRFIFAAYPDLSSRVAKRTVTLNVSTFKDGRVTIEAAAPSRTSQAGTVSVLFSTMYVDAAGLVVSQTAAGSALRGLDNSRLSLALLDHPAWTDGAAADWLRGNGPGISGNDLAARLASGSLATLRDFLGSDVIFGEPTLLWRSDVTSRRNGHAQFRTRPVWAVQARGRLPNGRSTTYRLEFEPFEGHLVGILRE